MKKKRIKKTEAFYPVYYSDTDGNLNVDTGDGWWKYIKRVFIKGYRIEIWKEIK